jgi:hypothetical protein
MTPSPKYKEIQNNILTMEEYFVVVETTKRGPAGEALGIFRLFNDAIQFIILRLASYDYSRRDLESALRELNVVKFHKVGPGHWISVSEAPVDPPLEEEDDESSEDDNDSLREDSSDEDQD